MMRLSLVICLTLILLAACDPSEIRDAHNTGASTENERAEELARLRAATAAVVPFFKPMGEPEQGEWLSVYREQGETFEEYLAVAPAKLPADRHTIYIMPLGKFHTEEEQIVRAATEYIEAFYGLTVKSLPIRSFPAKLQRDDYRLIDYPNHRQIRTGYILDEILTPALPQDAAALIAFTNEDLYPDSSMFFVFGQASFADRVGVWSLFRLNDMNADHDTFLRRTLKIAVH